MFIGWSYKKFRYFLLIYVHEKNKRPKGFKKGVVCCCIWSVYFSIHLDDISFFMFLMKVSNFFISRGNTVTIKANLPWRPQVNKWPSVIREDQKQTTLNLTPLCLLFLLCTSDQQEKKTQNINFLQDHPMNIPAKFGTIWPKGFRED
jgi:hypothetical protein